MTQLKGKGLSDAAAFHAVVSARFSHSPTCLLEAEIHRCRGTGSPSLVPGRYMSLHSRQHLLIQQKLILQQKSKRLLFAGANADSITGLQVRCTHRPPRGPHKPMFVQKTPTWPLPTPSAEASQVPAKVRSFCRHPTPISTSPTAVALAWPRGSS